MFCGLNKIPTKKKITALVCICHGHINDTFDNNFNFSSVNLCVNTQIECVYLVPYWAWTYLYS